MPSMIFVNLPTRDLERSDAFYGALGFTKNPDFSDENASSWMISDSIFVMVLKEAFYSSFLRGGDVAAFGEGSKQMLNALSCASVEEVDRLAETAAATGGAIYRQPAEEVPGMMYGGAVTDPDGHVWELAWMDFSGGAPQ
ncbi:VOC family protein [Zafaria sp. Z1313]|uniref:VOC family protein n=1 Tax=unclassified Zafaria TaxID=2828765 RepID=UPI002E7A4D22|nr:VOC family protein [Zafaria sp. J156]MEE1621033.1 VOC family protein [Zafaria sp. J156]